jgi:tetratricopeptide (TPR) repeat protein
LNFKSNPFEPFLVSFLSFLKKGSRATGGYALKATTTTFLSKVFNLSSERYLKTAGDLFIYDGNYEAALDMVDKTLAIAPDEVRALVLRGDILYCLNRDNDALQCFETALTVDENSVEAWISKASVLDALGRPQEGLTCCLEAFERLQDNQGYLLLCLVDQQLSLLIQMRRYRQAKALMALSVKELNREEALSLLETHGPALDSLGRRRNRSVEKAQRQSLRVLPAIS